MSDDQGLLARRCASGHLATPGHPICRECGQPAEETVDLADETATVVTWTTSTATPPGVREPNTLAIVEFTVDGQRVRTIGQATDDVASGDRVEPVYVAELRDPDAGIREPASQRWDGYRFRPIDE